MKTHTHQCPACKNTFACTIEICAEWPFPIRCDDCIKADDAALIEETPPRQAITKVPHGVLYVPTVYGEKYAGIQI